MAKRKRLNIVRKSGKPQTDKQLVDSSNEVNHNINEEYAQFGVGTKFLPAKFLSSFVLMFHSCFNFSILCIRYKRKSNGCKL